MKEKILIIPDVHGRCFWKKAVETGDYEKVVFLGDYTDPYEWENIAEDDALNNFLSIIEYKEQNPDKVVLLLGNHDMHYYSEYYHELTELLCLQLEKLPMSAGHAQKKVSFW